MYFHNSLIPRGAYFLLPLESKQEATFGWNFTKCISEVKFNQSKVNNIHAKMGISTFKCTWVSSSSSSKNTNIFLNLFINSINLKMSIYLSISKMCSSLFSRRNQACARIIANAKRTTQSRDAALSAIYIKGTRLTFELARWPWQPNRFFESEIHDICWGIMNTYFLILWILPSGFGWNWCQNWRFILSTMCANDTNFRVSTRPLMPFLVLFVTTFEQKHRFLRVHFEAVITIFWTIWTIYYAT